MRPRRHRSTGSLATRRRRSSSPTSDATRTCKSTRAARALSKILIQLRVQGRNPGRFNGGYGVPRGFKGEKSKSPPNPLGLAERVPRPQAVEGVPSRHLHPPGSPAGQNLRFCRRLHLGALRSPLSPFAPLDDTCSFPRFPRLPSPDLPPRGRGTARRRWKEFPRIAPPLSPFAPPLEAPYTTPGAGSKPCSFQWGLWGS